MSWPNATLGDHIDVLSGFAFKSDRFNTESRGLPLIRIRDVLPGRTETFYDGDFEEHFLIKDGDILIGMDGEFNCSRWVGGKALLNQRVCRVKSSNGKLLDGYLFRFLPAALKKIEDKTPYVTVKHLSAKEIRNIEIPLPPLEEQRRIAAILDLADALRRKRREALDNVEKLIASNFLSMFGDPATNLHGFPTLSLGQASVVFSDGPFGSNLKSEHYVERGIRVIRLQNIGTGKFIDGDKAYISEEHFFRLKKHTCLPGDVLIGTLGDPNLRACIQPSYIPVALNKADCVQMRVNPEVCTPEFVAALLNIPSVERMAQSKILGQTRLRISMGRLRELKLPFPPIALQQQFAARVSQISQLRGQYLEHYAQLDALFASLQHRAFRGEL